MSGGSWDYFCYNLDQVADRLICEKGNALRIAFGRHLKLCAEAMKSIEWVDSGDYGNGDDEDDIRKALGKDSDVLEIAEIKKELEKSIKAANKILKRIGT